MRLRKYILLIFVVAVISCKKESPASSVNQNSIVFTPGPGFSSQVTALAILNGNLIAAHSDSVSEWNGVSWNTIGSGLNGTTNAVVVYNGNLVVAGGTPYTNQGFVEMWNGSSWTDLGGGFNNSINALVVYNGNLIAGGGFDTTSGGPGNYISQWNGSTWQKVGVGFRFYSAPYSPVVNALTIYNGNLVAGGNFDLNGAIGVPTGGVAQWNGSAWSLLSNGVGGGVYCFASYNGNLVAGGSFAQVLGGDSAINIAQWNGASWTALGTSKIGTLGYTNQGTVVLSLSNYNNNLIVGGSFFSVGNMGVSGLAEYTGTSWASPFGGITEYSLAETAPGNPELVAGPDIIYSSIVYNGNLVVGGYFNTAGSIHASCIALWNGSSWSAL